MNSFEKTFLTALTRFLGLFWLVRAVTAAAKWMYFRTLEIDDDVLVFAQNVVAVDFITSVIAAVLLFVLATRIAGLLVKPSSAEVVASHTPAHPEREVWLLVGLRLIAVVVIVFGLVHGVSSIAGWFLHTWSGYVSNVWFPEAELRSGAIRGVASSVIGLILFAGSSNLARHFASTKARDHSAA